MGPDKQTKHANVKVVADPKTGKLSIRKVTQTLLSNEEAPKSCMKGGCWYKEEIAKTYAAINKDVVEFIAEGQAPPTNVKDLENYVDPLMADPDAELLPGVNRLSKPASFAEAAKYQAKANSICNKLAAKYGNFWKIICGPANKIDYVAIKKSVKAKVKKAIVSRGKYASADGS